jgi:hypothetical protein
MGREHDGNRFRQLLDNPNFRRRCREYDVDVYADQLGGKLRQLLDRFRPAEFDGNVLDVAELAQAGLQRLNAAGRRGG